jgi:transposase-like protein
MIRISYKRQRFPPAVIQYTEWLHLRFTLRLCAVEEVLGHRVVDAPHEHVTRSVSVSRWSGENLPDFLDGQF